MDPTVEQATPVPQTPQPKPPDIKARMSEMDSFLGGNGPLPADAERAIADATKAEKAAEPQGIEMPDALAEALGFRTEQPATQEVVPEQVEAEAPADDRERRAQEREQQIQERAREQALTLMYLQQLQQQQQPQLPVQHQAPSPVETRQQFETAMREAGLNPAVAEHRLLAQTYLQQAQLQAAYDARIQAMEAQYTQLQQQAYAIQLETQVVPEIDRALKAYEAIPPETAQFLRQQILSQVAQGANRNEAIQNALRPILPLLKQRQKTQPVMQPRPKASEDSRRQIAAVSIGGRGGGRVAPPKLSSDQLPDFEKWIFG